MSKGYPHRECGGGQGTWMSRAVHTERATEGLRQEGVSTLKLRGTWGPAQRTALWVAKSVTAEEGLESRDFPRRPHGRTRNCGQENERKPWAIWDWQWAKIQADYREGKRQVHPESHIKFIGIKWFFLSKTPVLLTQYSNDRNGADRSWTPHRGPCPSSFVEVSLLVTATEASLGHTSWVICFPRMLSPSRILRAATLNSLRPHRPPKPVAVSQQVSPSPHSSPLRHTAVSEL